MTDREIEKLKGESLVELRVKARNLGVKSVTTYNKSGLIEKIKEAIQGGNIDSSQGLDNKEDLNKQEEINEDTKRHGGNPSGERGQYRSQQDGNQGQQKRKEIEPYRENSKDFSKIPAQGHTYVVEKQGKAVDPCLFQMLFVPVRKII